VTISLSPTIGWAGTLVQVTGHGWEPTETITISLLEPSAAITQAADFVPPRWPIQGGAF